MEEALSILLSAATAGCGHRQLWTDSLDSRSARL